jgi:hypothetical protein
MTDTESFEHFAEARVPGPGMRVFQVYHHNQLMIGKLDVFAEVGKSAALVKEFEIALPRGEIEPKRDNIKNNAISTGSRSFR